MGDRCDAQKACGHFDIIAYHTTFAWLNQKSPEPLVAGVSGTAAKHRKFFDKEVD